MKVGAQRKKEGGCMTVKKRVAYKIPFDYRLFLFKVNYF